jgi:hypothetical protein
MEASWFETPRQARLLTMRVQEPSSLEEDLVLRSIAKRGVSKDEAMEVEIAWVARSTGSVPPRTRVSPSRTWVHDGSRETWS